MIFCCDFPIAENHSKAIGENKMDRYNICPSCFRTLTDSEICRHCGKILNEVKKIPYGLPTGTVINGRYMIGEVLGIGGFAVTYKAYDKKLEQIIAIKEFFPAGFANRAPGTEKVIKLNEEEFSKSKAAFLEEAKNTAKFFGSRNIVNVFDCFEANGTAYLVMEFLDGINLKNFVAQNGGKLDSETSVEIICNILEGLREIHKSGLTHRDLSLDNIMLTVDGRTVIIDLGAAKYNELQKANSDNIVVKMGYAPPEQYQRNAKQGAFTDTYAVGAMLYKMLVGVLPDESLDRQEKDTLALPTQLDGQIPAYLDNICLRALALQSSLRFQSAEQFLLSLKKRGTRSPKQILKLRRIIAASASAAVAVIMTVCIGLGITFRGAGNEVNLNKYIKEDTTVEIWIPYLSEEGKEETEKIYTAVFECFEKSIQENDGKKSLKSQITVIPTYIPLAEYNDRLLEASENGALPDVYRTDLTDFDRELVDLTWIKKEIIKDNYALGKEIKNYDFYLPVSADCDVAYVNRKYDMENTLAQAYDAETFSESLSKLSLKYPDLLRLADDAQDEAFKEGKAIALEGKMSDFDSVKKSVKWFTVMPNYQNYGDFVTAEAFGVNQNGNKSHQYASMYVMSYLLSDEAQEIMYIENNSFIPLNKSILEVYVWETHKNDVLDFLFDITLAK